MAEQLEKTREGIPIARKIPFKGMQKRIADHMLRSHLEHAELCDVVECDVTEMVKLRQELNQKKYLPDGKRTSFTPMLLKITAHALRQHPRLNGHIMEDEILILDDINIGIATDIGEDGLIVPVIFHVDKKPLNAVAEEVDDLVNRARNRKLKVAEVQGGTFTVTNHGILGVDLGTPIINMPQIAILATGRIVEKPAVRDGEIVIRSFLWWSLTTDHRAINGAPAVAFLSTLGRIMDDSSELQNALGILS